MYQCGQDDLINAPRSWAVAMTRKIGLLVGYYPIDRGGAEHQAYLLAQTLRERYETFYISAGQDSEECLHEEGMKIYTLKSPGLLCFKNAFFLLRPKILRILEYERPDIIYQRSAYSGTGIAAMYCRRSGCRLVWHIASEREVMPDRSNGDRWNPVNYIERKCRDYGVKHADVIIGQTGHQDELLQRNYGRRCDLIVGNAHPEPSEAILKDARITVVWVANMKPLKQPEIFIRLARMLHYRSDVRFVMIGKPASGRYQKRIEKAMERLPSLTYRGERPMDEVNRTLAEAHVFVNTSLYEGFPNTFIQAWLRQVPVVSLNVDPDNVLKTHRIGFHSRSLEGLAKDVERLIDDADLRALMGGRAQAYALRHHSMGPNTERVLSLLASLH